MAGLEPATVCLQSRCTTNCATSPKRTVSADATDTQAAATNCGERARYELPHSRGQTHHYCFRCRLALIEDTFAGPVYQSVTAVRAYTTTSSLLHR